MKKLLWILPVAALATMIPVSAPADDWYEEPWFWGGAGLVTGGVLGYVVGRDSAYRHDRHRAVVPYRYGCEPGGYYDSAPVNLTGAYYVREKRAFPFYHKTEYYPLASTMPRVYQPQAVSVAEPGKYILGSSGEDETSSKSDGVNITIGDNNENVSVTVGSVGEGEKAKKEVVTVAKPNHDESLPGRVVDERVVIEKDVEEVEVEE